MNPNNTSVMLVAGTRPEIIKIAPVIKGLKKEKIDYVFVWSGQHYDYEMSKLFFEQLKLPKPDIYLDIKNSLSVTEQISNIILKLKENIEKYNPKIIYALGDTTTTLSAALAASYSNKPFIHDEAGMRSFDSIMYEEKNRRISDTIASFRLAPTKLAFFNLLIEGVPYTTIKLVGSTIVDSLLNVLKIVEKNKDSSSLWETIGLKKEGYILLTLHRRENLVYDRLHRIVRILKEISKLNNDVKIVFPIHPHTRYKLKMYNLFEKLTSIKNILLPKPLGYVDFITLMKNAKVIMTDSGGIQEEAFILGKYTITLRKNTEWPETVIMGYNYLLDMDPRKIITVVSKLLDFKDKKPLNNRKNPLGDGRSGNRIATILKEIITNPNSSKKNTIELNDFEQKYPYLIPSLINKEFTMTPSFEKNIIMCFSQSGIPVIDEKLVSEGKKELCLSRMSIKKIIRGKTKIKKFIEIDWCKIDRNTR